MLFFPARHPECSQPVSLLCILLFMSRFLCGCNIRKREHSFVGYVFFTIFSSLLGNSSKTRLWRGGMKQEVIDGCSFRLVPCIHPQLDGSNEFNSSSCAPWVRSYFNIFLVTNHRTVRFAEPKVVFLGGMVLALTKELKILSLGIWKPWT